MLSLAQCTHALRGATLPVSSLLVSSTRAMATHMHSGDPHQVKELKEKHLKGESEVHVPGTEGWSHGLASASEAVVKADKAPDIPVKDMQAHTVNVIQQEHHTGSTSKTGIDNSNKPSVKENLEHTRKPSPTH